MGGRRARHLTVTTPSLYTTCIVIISAIELRYRPSSCGTNDPAGLFIDKKPISAMHALSAVAAGMVACTAHGRVRS